MHKNDARSRFFEAKQKVQAIYNQAKTENRALTEDESNQAAQYRAEMTQAQTEMQIEAGERLAAALNVSAADKRAVRLAFAKAAVEASRTGEPIQLRDDPAPDPVSMTKSDAQDLVGLQIGDIIGPLEKGLVLGKVGCRLQTGLHDDWAYPVIEAVEASIEGEDTEVGDSEIDINAVKPTPHRVAIAIPVTKTALTMTNDRLFDIVVEQITMAIKRTLNKWMFKLSAVATGVNGLFVSPGTSNESEEGGKFSYKDICTLVGDVDGTGIVPSQSAAFVMTNAVKAELKATPRGNGDRMIIENDAIDGVPVYVTEYAAEDTVYFGYFDYALVGQFGDMDLIVDPYTLSKKHQVRFVLNALFDMKAARAEAFGILTKSEVTEEAAGGDGQE